MKAKPRKATSVVGKTLTMVSLLTQLALHLAVQHQRLPVLVYLCVRHRRRRHHWRQCLCWRCKGYGAGCLPKTSRTHAFGLRKRIGYSASRETTWEDPFGNDPNDPFACARAMECQRALWVSYPIIGFGCACAIVIFLSRSVFTESAKCMPRAQTQAFEITR